MDMGKKGLYMIQSLVFAYIATGILLCLLAFIIYQSNAGMKIANLGVTFTYILASVFAGMLIGSKIGKKKFLWGFAAGMLYFMILTLISWIFQKKYRSVFHRKDHSMFLMYCRRNFRWNACYLKMNMIQYSKLFYENQEDDKMKHIKTLTNKTLQNTVKKGGCGECQTSCQSACKTSCTVGNQTCEHSK